MCFQVSITASETGWYVAVLASVLATVAMVVVAASKLRERRRRNRPYDFNAILAKLQRDGVLDDGAGLPDAARLTATPLYANTAIDDHSYADTRSSSDDGSGSDDDGAPLLGQPDRRQLALGDGVATPAAGVAALQHDGAEGGIQLDMLSAGTGNRPGTSNSSCSWQAPLVQPREIARSALTILKRIGGGNFGDVHAGMLNERSTNGLPSYHVAVKTPKPDADGSNNKKDLLEEAALMAQFDHTNIVALIGVVSRYQDCQVVLQFCEKGSLQSLLREDRLNKGAPSIPRTVALRIACEVTAGMAYLESKRFVHRDLATRNVLVGADENCLVADFGLSRALQQKDYYKVRGGTAVPIRWCAPEVMQSGSRFTSASDVWSFFVLMWEVWSRAQMPFGTESNMQVTAKLEDVSEGLLDSSALLPAPDAADKSVYTDLQLRCWVVDPTQRASFATLEIWLRQRLDSIDPDRRPSGSAPCTDDANAQNRGVPSRVTLRPPRLLLVPADDGSAATPTYPLLTPTTPTTDFTMGQIPPTPTTPMVDWTALLNRDLAHGAPPPASQSTMGSGPGTPNTADLFGSAPPTPTTPFGSFSAYSAQVARGESADSADGPVRRVSSYGVRIRESNSASERVQRQSSLYGTPMKPRPMPAVDDGTRTLPLGEATTAEVHMTERKNETMDSMLDLFGAAEPGDEDTWQRHGSTGQGVASPAVHRRETGATDTQDSMPYDSFRTVPRTLLKTEQASGYQISVAPSIVIEDAPLDGGGRCLAPDAPDAPLATGDAHGQSLVTRDAYDHSLATGDAYDQSLATGDAYDVMQPRGWRGHAHVTSGPTFDGQGVGFSPASDASNTGSLERRIMPVGGDEGQAGVPLYQPVASPLDGVRRSSMLAPGGVEYSITNPSERRRSSLLSLDGVEYSITNPSERRRSSLLSPDGVEYSITNPSERRWSSVERRIMPVGVDEGQAGVPLYLPVASPLDGDRERRSSLLSQEGVEYNIPNPRK